MPTDVRDELESEFNKANSDKRLHMIPYRHYVEWDHPETWDMPRLT